MKSFMIILSIMIKSMKYYLLINFEDSSLKLKTLDSFHSFGWVLKNDELFFFFGPSIYYSIIQMKYSESQSRLLSEVTNHGELPSQTPIIGIYTQAYDHNSTYIAASYVKFIEMSGAQVVPLYSFAEPSSILTTLRKINGVLFTGTVLYIQVAILGLISKRNGRKMLTSFLNLPFKRTRKATFFPFMESAKGISSLHISLRITMKQY